MADLDEKNEVRPASGGGSLLLAILDFILGRESDPQKRILQTSQKQLNKTGHRFYKLSKDRLLPQFASLLYGVYEVIDPLREFFLGNTSDAYYAHAVIDYFSTEKMDELVESLSEESLEARGADKDFPALKEEAHNLFDRLTAAYGKDLAGRANALYNSVMVLKQFCLVDYYAILKRFKPDLVEHRFEPNVGFGQLTRAHALDVVPDFLSSVSNLLFVEDWSSQFEFISTLPGYKTFDPKLFISLHDKLLKMNSLGVFANFGRLLLHEPSYEAEPKFPSEDVVKAYLDQISHDMEEVLSEIDIKKKNQLLEMQMKEVFGGVKVMDLQNYTEESSEVLESIKADLEEGKKLAYTRYAQARYYHTLVETYLGKSLLEFVENFAVRAEIYGGDYTAKFSAEYHQMISANDEIMKLDMELGQGFPNGYKIAMLVEAARRSNDAAKKLYTEINLVNKQFSEQLDKGMEILRSSLKKFTKLLEDKRSISPSIVKNWSTIDEYLREPSLNSLTEATARLSHFVSLMDSFN
ncbi:MAG: hypothetical protein ILP18_01730 [Treponema sp.]|nr:hypothetical protein [Treponema sp.]